MATSDYDAATRSGVPESVYDLRQTLNGLMLQARGDLLVYEKKIKFTYNEAAYLAGCGVSTIRDAVADKRIIVGTSGWITRDALTGFLGYDPIAKRRDELIKLARQSIDLAREVEALFDETNTNQQNSPDPVSKIEPAA